MSKSIIVKCRLTPEENERVKAKAKGLNFSDFFRAKLLDEPVPQPVPQNKPAKSDVVATKSAIAVKPKRKTVKVVATKPEAPIIEKKSVATKSKETETSYRRFAEPGSLLKK